MRVNKKSSSLPVTRLIPHMKSFSFMMSSSSGRATSFTSEAPPDLEKEWTSIQATAPPASTEFSFGSTASPTGWTGFSGTGPIVPFYGPVCSVPTCREAIPGCYMQCLTCTITYVLCTACDARNEFLQEQERPMLHPYDHVMVRRRSARVKDVGKPFVFTTPQ